MDNHTLSRRKFLKATSLTGTALCLGYYFPAGAGIVKVMDTVEENTAKDLNAWVRIDTSGKVTLFCHRAEMGQGAFQAVPQIIAEELEVNLHEVEVLFAKGHPKKYGSQVTGGSSTVRTKYKDLLKLGASAREMLIEVAAQKWGVQVSECYAEGGHVFHRPAENSIMENW
jgi:isoquinoline 1-oxidoreductase beta subunit